MSPWHNQCAGSHKQSGTPGEATGGRLSKAEPSVGFRPTRPSLDSGFHDNGSVLYVARSGLAY